MRLRALFVPLLIVVCLICAAATPSPDMRMTDAARAARQFEQLTVLSPEPGEASSRLRWAVWDNGFGSDQAVDLVLFQRHADSPERLWSQRWPGGYLPRIQNAWNWQYESRPMLLLIFQYGAALEHLELFGLDKQGLVIPLARAEATFFETHVTEAGLRIIAGQGAGEPPRCLQYHSDPPQLVDAACNASR